MNRFAKGFFAAALAAAVFLGGLWAVPQASAEGLSPPRPKFTDLPSMPWYYDFLIQSVNLGFFSGTSSTTFSPDRPLTRAQAVVVLSKVHKELTGETISASQPVDYTDVSPNSYYSKAVAWATVNKIVSGRGNHRFAPNQPVTHAELAVMFHRYLELVGRADLYQPIPGKYENEAGLPGWAQSHAQAISGFEILEATESGFVPQKATDRGEASALFVRLYEKAAYPADWKTPRQKYIYYRTFDEENGEYVPLLPLGDEHKRVISSYEEYQQVVDTLQSAGEWSTIEQPTPLELSEEFFSQHNLVGVEIQPGWMPAFDCDFGGVSLDGTAATVTLIGKNRYGTAGTGKAILYLAQVPKEITEVEISRLNWTQITNWMPA